MTEPAGRTQFVRDRGRVQNHGDAAHKLAGPGDFVVVERGRPRSIVLSCPDGCGEVITINLDPRGGPAWRLYVSRKGVTLYPSIWRESGCGSHFIVWNSKIFWCDAWDEDPSAENLDRDLDSRVLAALPLDSFVAYFDVAFRLGEIPWDVLRACRRLERAGVAQCGVDAERFLFRRLST